MNEENNVVLNQNSLVTKNLMTIVSALMGTLASTAISILFMYVFEYMHPVSFVLFPILTSILIVLFNGRTGWFSILITAVASFLGIFISEMCFMTKNSGAVPLLSVITRESIYAWIFLALGMWVAAEILTSPLTLRISKKKKHIRKHSKS